MNRKMVDYAAKWRNFDVWLRERLPELSLPAEVANAPIDSVRAMLRLQTKKDIKDRIFHLAEVYYQVTKQLQGKAELVKNDFLLDTLKDFGHGILLLSPDDAKPWRAYNEWLLRAPVSDLFVLVRYLHLFLSA